MNIKERKRQGKRRRLALSAAGGGLLALLMAAGGAQRGAVAGLEESPSQAQAILPGERQDRSAQGLPVERAAPARQVAARPTALKVLGTAGAASAVHPAWPEQAAGDGAELPSAMTGTTTEPPLRRPVAEQDLPN